MDVLAALQKILAESHDPGNPGPDDIKEIMETVKRIAVVGISRNPEKAARRIPSYLAAQGYDIVPVNPFVDRILGKEAVDSLDQVTDPLDMVLVFRPSEEAAAIAEEALKREERPVIWLQEGIQADPVAAKARAQGIRMIQDLCAFKVHQALKG
jgi:hypothetical protein